ncbi:MAG: class 1 fructose-bisphosphatase [Sulfurospirillum sp.]
MVEIFDAIKKSAIRIKKLIEDDDSEYSQNINATGDVQLKLDIKSDLVIEEEFRKISSVREIISEEKEEKTPIYNNGKYMVGYDPLDGSSLLNVNFSVGSIFGIYKNGYDGKDMVAAVYVIYGPTTQMITAYEDVGMYRLNDNGDFVFMKSLELDNEGHINATGATHCNWSKSHVELVEEIYSRGHRLRYSGGMVPDLHQILLKGGGLFSYPGTTDHPKGKLRMVFEVFPFAFIFEKAGGEAIDGRRRLLDLTPTHPHDTTPCYFGSKKEIELVLKHNE